MCPYTATLALAGLQISQARSAAKAVEEQNKVIQTQQTEAINRAKQQTQAALSNIPIVTTGSGADPAATLASEIKKAKQAKSISDDVFNTPQSGTGLNI